MEGVGVDHGADTWIVALHVCYRKAVGEPGGRRWRRFEPASTYAAGVAWQRGESVIVDSGNLPTAVVEQQRAEGGWVHKWRAGRASRRGRRVPFVDAASGTSYVDPPRSRSK